MKDITTQTQPELLSFSIVCSTCSRVDGSPPK